MEHLLPDTMLSGGCANLIRTIPGEMKGSGGRLNRGAWARLIAPGVAQAGWSLMLENPRNHERIAALSTHGAQSSLCTRRCPESTSISTSISP